MTFLAGPDRLRRMFEREPGTYLLTDFLIRSFRRSVLAELGLDSRPELWPDYFGHYRRVVWLRRSRDPALDAEAAAVAEMFGLPLTVVDVGTGGLERELELLLTEPRAPLPRRPAPSNHPGRPSGPPGRQRDFRPMMNVNLMQSWCDANSHSSRAVSPMRGVMLHGGLAARGAAAAAPAL